MTFRRLGLCALLLLVAFVLSSCAGTNTIDLGRNVRRFQLGDQWLATSRTFAGSDLVLTEEITVSIVNTTFAGVSERAFRYVVEGPGGEETFYVVYSQASSDGTVTLLGEIEGDGTEIFYNGEDGLPGQIGIGSSWITEFAEGDQIVETTNHVTARESVTVPGGTFDSYRYDVSVVGIAQSSGTGWLDPAVGYPLKQILIVPTSTGEIRIVEELDSFTPAP